AMTHVILQEYYVIQPNAYFINYSKQYTDMPLILLLHEDANGLKAGRFLLAEDLEVDTPNGDWKHVIIDKIHQHLNIPKVTIGKSWEEGKQRNRKLEDEQGFKVDPALRLAEDEYEIKQIQFPYFNNEGNGVFERPIAAKKIELADGEQKYV